MFNGVEINSTFYRRNRTTTFECWTSAVPDDFRSAVKLPHEITQEHRLRAIGQLFKTFVEELPALNGKLGPLLCQSPSTLEFDVHEAAPRSKPCVSFFQACSCSNRATRVGPRSRRKRL
ncbi:DUF72 domain-containing protein [Rhizobium nepotum]|uniref:DUF72 domain-containing protein n=1 Tax=Rhizobium nepotum TaxID=1035271 RepID=UPI00336AD93C